MTKEEARVYELLKEFDRICSSNNIKYCISGETLAYAVLGSRMEPRTCRAFAIMTADNILKFIKWFKENQPENREIEYWGNSDLYPDYTLRYVASDTTGFNMVDALNYNTHGMYIEISILRGEDRKTESRKNRSIERGILLNSYCEATLEAEKKRKSDLISNGLYKTLSTVTGRKKVRRSVFDYFSTKCVKPVSKGKGMSGVYAFTSGGKKFRDISENYFGRPGSIEIEGYTFPAPRNARTFLRKIFGGRFKTTKAGDEFEDKMGFINNCVIDPDTPYKESFRELNLTKEDFLSIYRSKIRIDTINQDNKGNNAIARKDWAIVRQTGERYRLWKKYMPLKDEIIALNEAGDYKGLARIFEDYQDALDEMQSQHCSFSFDNEIFDIYIGLLEHTGKFKEADRIMTELPKSHLKDIDIHE